MMGCVIDRTLYDESRRKYDGLCMPACLIYTPTRRMAEILSQSSLPSMAIMLQVVEMCLGLRCDDEAELQQRG